MVAVPTKRPSRRPTSRSPMTLTGRSSARSALARATASSGILESNLIVLEWIEGVVKVGYSGQLRPDVFIQLDKTSDGAPRTEEGWYEIIMPCLQQVYDRLMIAPSGARVVVVTSHLPPLFWERAFLQTCWDLLVPAVSFISALSTPPLVLGIERGIVVHVGRSEIQCMVHADGQTLENTYQVVRSTSQSAQEYLQAEWNDDHELSFLDERNPRSLIFALLKCVVACPLELRKQVVRNLFFCGDQLSPDIPFRVTQKINALLKDLEGETETPIDHNKEPCSDLTVVPIPLDSLTPLAGHFGAVSTHSHRADLVSWIGASLWAAIWHEHGDEGFRVKWMKPPESES